MSDEIVLYNTIKGESYGEFEDRKSRFLCYLKEVDSESDALAFISDIKKKHYDAKHNCSCMIIGPGKELVRSNDDKEPAGCAGKPMLEVLTGADITNVVCVVTRYFGGVLLGTGGLIRAYQSAVKEALANAQIVTVTHCVDVFVNSSYKEVTVLQHYFEQNKLSVLESTFLSDVTFKLRISESFYEQFSQDIISLTNASASITKDSEGYYPL